MSVWISLSLIIVCVIIVIFIILKKFPALAILDVERIPGNKEAKFKEQIIRQRLERDLSRVSVMIAKIWYSVGRFLANFLGSRYQRLKNLKDEYRRQKKVSLVDRQEKMAELLAIAKQAIKDEDWPLAESQLIEIIALDQKNLGAFLELADVYYQMRKFTEARATWEHSLKLYHQLKKNEELTSEASEQEILFSLADTCRQLEDLDSAINYINDALDVEPNNPRFLDLIFDLSIMRKDKKGATDYFARLSEVNPENQKLVELKKLLDDLEEDETNTKLLETAADKESNDSTDKELKSPISKN